MKQRSMSELKWDFSGVWVELGNSRSKLSDVSGVIVNIIANGVIVNNMFSCFCRKTISVHYYYVVTFLVLLYFTLVGETPVFL